jgi:hypothetical protein
MDQHYTTVTVDRASVERLAGHAALRQTDLTRELSDAVNDRVQRLDAALRAATPWGQALESD